MAKNTRKLLADSLRVQLTRKPLEKITISDITSGCDMNRMTFYYHFRDIYDLLDWIFRDIADKILKSGTGRDTWQDVLKGLFQVTLENRDLILHLYRSLGWGRAEQYLYGLVNPLVQARMEKMIRSSNLSEENATFVVMFLSCAITGSVEDWIANGMSDDYEGVYGRLITILNGMAEEAVRKFAV